MIDRRDEYDDYEFPDLFDSINELYERDEDIDDENIYEYGYDYGDYM